jgi:hypothetical protein
MIRIITGRGVEKGSCVAVSWGAVGDQFDLEGEQSFDEL